MIRLSVLLLFIFTSCQFSKDDTATNATEAKAQVDTLFEDYHHFKLRINPIEATKAGENEYNAQMANFISDDHQAMLLEQYTIFLKRAGNLPRSLLTSADQLSLKALIWDADIKKEGLENNLVTIASPMYDLPNFALLPITQITSLQLYFSQLAGGTSVQPFHTPEDYSNWIKRVDGYLLWLKTAQSKMKEGIEKGIVLPKVLIHRVIAQLEPFVNNNIEDHIFYQPIVNMPDSFTTIDRDPLTEAYRSMISDKIVPQYTELLRFMKEEYLSAGRNSDGLMSLPHGKETYEYLIRLHTSTDMTADEIFNLGKSEVARIEGEMEKVKESLGYQGDLRSFLQDTRTNPMLKPFNSPTEVIDNFNQIRKRLEGGITKLFDLKPKADFVVRRTEAFREQSASAEYVPGSKDGSRPGTFYMPLPKVEEHNVLMDEALFLHEAIPGHHYQLSLQQENEQLPAFLHAEGMGVFVEGWALYAESLGKELGLYEDPYQYFGMLSMEMHRAIRLVVDSGIHAKGWTREEAIAYSLQHEADSEAGITSEIERYMATPGQALSYKIGQLKIRALRTLAEQSLGSKFSIKEYHNQVLNSGSLPLSLLEVKLEHWINSEKEKAAEN